MRRFAVPLTARIFLAISATALLVVAIMAIMIAISMRDGFSRYLVQGEINRFDDLVLALTDLQARDPAAWDKFRQDPDRWRKFVGENFRPRGAPPPLEDPTGVNTTTPRGRRIDPLQLTQRLYLLDANGGIVVAGLNPGSADAERPVYASDGQTVIGTLGLTTPKNANGGTDTFFIRGQYASLALASLIAFALSLAAALIIARGVLAPIKAMEAGARILAKGNYALRIPTTRRDELGALIGHYNALAQSLQSAEATEREWISNTSHGLLTPLTILRANIEAVQDGIRLPDARTLEQMHSAVMRLSRLVQDLKVLSYSREAPLITYTAPSDLALIAQDAIDSMADHAMQVGLQLRCTIDGPLIADCDPNWIRQVIDNLLENAWRYTASPGEIVISGGTAAGLVAVTIDDTAPAPPSDALPHLFERFYRAEHSRSRAEGGSGLGLAICEAILKAHGGAITAELSPIGGLRVTFSLPEKGLPDV